LIKAKIEAAAVIANSDGETLFIKIPVAALQKDESHEAWYNNKLYDVAKRESANDTEYVYLIRDEDEQNVLNDNSEYFKNDVGVSLDSGYKASPQKKSLSLSDNNYVVSAVKKIFPCDHLFKSLTVKNKYCFTSICTDVPTPPPRNFLTI
jgi:hypothetical protein